MIDYSLIFCTVFNPSLSLSARPSKLSTSFCPELEVAMSLVDLQILGGNDASLFGQRRGSVSEQSADASSSAFDKVFPKLYKQLESLVVESRRKMESWTETIVEEITEIH